MVKLIFFLIALTFLSCTTGHLDKYGIYVPNTPNYRLKNIKTDQIPKELDTSNVYKYYGYYDENNILIKETFKETNWSMYKKFNSNGRVFGFGTDNLNEKNLDPNYASKDYYVYNDEKKIIKYETFTNGNGGQYVIIDFKLSKEGDTLTSIGKGKQYIVYIREKIPKEWKRHKSNW